ncbi:MAG TPA: hypothetical protein VM735_13910, partial [Candidatus Kapabacteria bacterium]|nr:hypothetical protein [Candidatus Kapabacteria bacterium]
MLGCSNSAEPPKSLEHHLGRKLTLPESSEAYATLHKAALPFLRKELSYEKYLFKFMHRRKYAKHPLGAKVVLSRAMEKVNTCPPPKEAEQFPDRDIQRLISLCYYLQLETGNKPFFLSSRQAEQLLGGKVSHTTAWQWLKVLEDPYGLIK